VPCEPHIHVPESNEMLDSKGRPIEEIEEQDAADLPDRQAMSLLNPTSLLGGTSIMPIPPTPDAATAPPADGAASPPVAPPGIGTHLPPGVSSLPPVTSPTPGAPYQPDAADTSKT
jgi:hypothetical protein